MVQGLEGFIVVLQGGLNKGKMKPVQEVCVHPAAVQQLVKAFELPKADLLLVSAGGCRAFCL